METLEPGNKCASDGVSASNRRTLQPTLDPRGQPSPAEIHREITMVVRDSNVRISNYTKNVPVDPFRKQFCPGPIGALFLSGAERVFLQRMAREATQHT